MHRGQQQSTAAGRVIELDLQWHDVSAWGHAGKVHQHTAYLLERLALVVLQRLQFQPAAQRQLQVSEHNRIVRGLNAPKSQTKYDASWPQTHGKLPLATQFAHSPDDEVEGLVAGDQHLRR